MEKHEKLRRDSRNKTRIKGKRAGKEEGKYVYCAILCSEKKSFGKIGVHNNEVYAIPYKNVAAVVSDSSKKDYELTEDNAKGHEKVIRQVMKDHTVVPAEFGTLIKTETTLRHLLSKAYAPTRDCLKLFDDMVELGAKAVINENTVFADAQRKECASDILGSLKAKAKQAVTSDLFSDRLILNASFLVNKNDVDAFSDEVERLQKKYPLLKILYSGPWAPYNFVYIKIGAEGVEITKDR
jgi:hypothetical protein